MKDKKINITYILLGTIILLLLTTMLSYAYFTANIHGSETESTIFADGGMMDIYYVDGTGEINASKIIPKNTPFADKDFTITGNNSTSETMYYNLNLVIENNTFTDYAISYKLTSTNTNSNGTIVPSSTQDMCYILNGPQTEVLGNGTFTGPTNGNKTHTYNLKMFFPDTGILQNENFNKTIAAYIKIEEGEKEASSCKQTPPSGIAKIILTNNGGFENITEAPAGTFDKIAPAIVAYAETTYEDTSELYSDADKTIGTGYIFNEINGKYELTNYLGEQTYSSDSVGKYTCDSRSYTYCTIMYKINAVSDTNVTNSTRYQSEVATYDYSDTGMYKTEDDYGDSYYFRGAKTYVNNNLIFAEHQWKIIRINGDGSLRIIYNGECPGNTCTINSNGTITHMKLPSGNSLYNSSGRSAYNLTNRDDAKYVGYMYGGANGVASTSRLQATTNETDTYIKSYLDEWYKINISGTDYEDHISDALFCNDREMDTSYGTGLGYAKNQTAYMSRYRLKTNKTPSLKCANTNDRFTTTNYNNVSVPGNNALEYPIGLLTADEGALAGLKNGSDNSTNYLFTYQSYWTMSPDESGASYVVVWSVNLNGYLYAFAASVDNASGVRGVINLKPNTPITGTGTTLDPYLAGE